MVELKDAAVTITTKDGGEISQATSDAFNKFLYEATTKAADALDAAAALVEVIDAEFAQTMRDKAVTYRG